MHPAPPRQILCLLALLVGGADVIPAAALPLDHDITDGAVFATAISGDQLLLGGAFSYVGPPTGGVARVDGTTGTLDTSLPAINGSVSAMVSDGAGGWFIGGSFTEVGGLTRQNLARILADNSVAPFSVGTNSSVEALVRSGDTLYVGGLFVTLGGQARARLGAVNTVTGAVLGFNPGADGNVRTLLLHAATLFVGGEFTHLAGIARNRLGAVNPSTGVLQPWNPDAGSLVWTLVRSGSTIYAGGNFVTVGGLSRPNVAAIDAVTGAVSAWTPNPAAPVRAVAVAGGTVYLGGVFQSVAGMTRKSIAAVDAVTGALLPWAPSVTPDFSSVLALLVDGPNIRIGGTFRSAGGQSRDRLAEINRTTGSVTAWAPSANGAVDVLEPSGSQVMIGGSFSSVGGATRSNLAAISRTTGRVTSWSPGVTDTVRALAASDGTVFAAGQFTVAAGVSRNRLAAFAAGTGALLPWNPGADGPVFSLIASDDRVFVGGRYDTIGGASRPGLASVHGTTGLVRPWNPGITPFFDPVMVRSMILFADTLVVVGNFAGTGGSSFLLNIAAFDTAIAGPLDWGPKTVGLMPLVIGQVGTTGYVCGNLSSMGGAGRFHLGAFDLRSGMVLPFTPVISHPVHAVSGLNGRVYIGGEFSMVDGSPRTRFAAFDQASGTLGAWNPPVDGVVEHLMMDEATLVLGGQFLRVDDRPATGIGTLVDPTPSAVPPGPGAGGAVEGTPLTVLSVGPNPAAGGFTIHFRRQAPGRLSLELFDPAGRRVAALVVDRAVPAGDSQWTVPLPALRAGVHLWRLSGADGARAGKITIAR